MNKILFVVALLLISSNVGKVNFFAYKESNSSFESSISDDFVLSNETSQFWFEDVEYLQDKLVINGPCVARAEKKAGYVWETAISFDNGPGWDFDVVPYLVIFTDADSDQLKTRLYAGPHGKGPVVATTVYFQGVGFVGNFGHSFEWKEDDLGNWSYAERFYFDSGENYKAFDLEKGRIFLVTKKPGSEKFVVKQNDTKLPARKIFKDFHLPISETPKSYQQLEDWALENELITK